MKRKTIPFLALLLMLSTVFSVAASAAESTTGVYEEIEVTLSDTTIVQDFQNLEKLDGHSFDPANYPAGDADADPQLLTVVEDCDLPRSYVLYFYIYNPSCRELAVSGNQISVSFDGVFYKNYGLSFISHYEDDPSTSDRDERFLFYKFKLSTISFTTKSRLSPSERQVILGGFSVAYAANPSRLFEYGAGNTFHNVGKSHRSVSIIFEGNGDSAHMTSAVGIDALNLDVDMTYYRVLYDSSTCNLSSFTLGLASEFVGTESVKNYYHQLQTAYFAIPDSYLEKYGTLQAVRYEAYKLTDVPIVLRNFQPKDFDNPIFFSSFRFNPSLNYQFREMISFSDPVISSYSSLKNAFLDTLPIKFQHDPDAFYYSPIKATLNNPSSVASFYSNCYDENGNLTIRSEELLFYFLMFPQYLQGGEYINLEGSLKNPEDYLSASSYVDNANFFEKVSDLGLFDALFSDIEDDSFENVAPIGKFDPNDKHLDDDAFSKKYYVAKSDVTDIQRRMVDAASSGSSLYFFRFSVDSYSESSAALYGTEKNNGRILWKRLKNLEKNNGLDEELFFTYNTVYKDYDILATRWQKGQDEFLIPVVSNPVKLVISDISTGGSEGPEVTTPGDKLRSSFSDFNWRRILSVALIVISALAVISISIKLSGVRAVKASISNHNDSSVEQSRRSKRIRRRQRRSDE